MTVYSGLAIGGPYAGSLIAHRSQVFECLESRPVLLRDGPPIGTVPVSAERYHWHLVEGHGLWILEGQTLADAFNELAVGYQELHNGRR